MRRRMKIYFLRVFNWWETDESPQAFPRAQSVRTPLTKSERPRRDDPG